MNIDFVVDEEKSEIEIIDVIERRQYRLETQDEISLAPASTDRFLFPVDRAVSILTDELVLPSIVAIYVRDEEGTMLSEAEHFAHESLPSGTYSIEICAPIKIYLHVEESLTVTADDEEMALEFGAETEVLIGARSHHKHPAASITTTDDPADMMSAISEFGSALKTTTPERSYPTLRGHPPTIELGDSLNIPSELETPDTGIRIELPPEHRYIYVTASLAYYLGAEIVPGEEPRLVTDVGFTYSLDRDRGFEEEVERVLKQVFFLDCVTRTEGYYEIDLHERRAIESRVDLDFATLYEKPLSEQIAHYLTVPFDLIKDQLPEWKLTTHIEPEAENIEQLPFVVNDLAVIHTPESQPVQELEPQLGTIDAFTRDEVMLRSATSEPSSSGQSYVQPDATDSLEHAWIGEKTPMGASKLTSHAFHNRLDRSAKEGDISITVVCNDAEMEEERNFVDEVYGDRDDLPFDVTIERNLTREALCDVLTNSIDFFHYIGHIETGGILCSDGQLDVASIDSTAIDAFLLNGCNSYNQGMALIEAGAIGGVVTLSQVINSGAIRIGRVMARLMNRGFPLRAALTIARDESIMGGQYIVVGDGGLSVTQTRSGSPIIYDIERQEDCFEVGITTYTAPHGGMGELFKPAIEGNQAHFLSSGPISTFEMSEEELEHFLRLEDFPIKNNSELFWSSDVNLSSLN